MPGKKELPDSPQRSGKGAPHGVGGAEEALQRAGQSASSC